MEGPRTALPSERLLVCYRTSGCRAAHATPVYQALPHLMACPAANGRNLLPEMMTRW